MALDKRTWVEDLHGANSTGTGCSERYFCQQNFSLHHCALQRRRVQTSQFNFVFQFNSRTVDLLFFWAKQNSQQTRIGFSGWNERRNCQRLPNLLWFRLHYQTAKFPEKGPKRQTLFWQKQNLSARQPLCRASCHLQVKFISCSPFEFSMIPHSWNNLGFHLVGQLLTWLPQKCFQFIKRDKKCDTNSKWSLFWVPHSAGWWDWDPPLGWASHSLSSVFVPQSRTQQDSHHYPVLADLAQSR